jgi:hypothetical protein
MLKEIKVEMGRVNNGDTLQEEKRISVRQTGNIGREEEILRREINFVSLACACVCLCTLYCVYVSVCFNVCSFVFECE